MLEVGGGAELANGRSRDNTQLQARALNCSSLLQNLKYLRRQDRVMSNASCNNIQRDGRAIFRTETIFAWILSDLLHAFTCKPDCLSYFR